MNDILTQQAVILVTLTGQRVIWSCPPSLTSAPWRHLTGVVDATIWTVFLVATVSSSTT